MKHFYTTVIALLISIVSIAQGYELGIVHTTGFDFKIVAIPDFSASTDASDMGFALVLPAGTTDIINAASLLAGRTWGLQEFDAAFLTTQGLGDGTKDVFLFNNPPGQSLIAHTAGVPIDLVSFTLTNVPGTGDMLFLDNADPIATGAGGVLDSFFNSNIDNTTTQDYFMGYAAGLESFMFSTLSINEVNILAAAITVSPNPTVDTITIESTIAIKETALYDITGKLILKEVAPSTINLSQLPSGLYMLKLKTETSTIVKRIIKK